MKTLSKHRQTRNEQLPMLSMFPKVKQKGVVLDHVACMNHDQLVLVDKPRPDVTRGLGWAFENHY